MESDLEDIYNILLQANLPASMNDLKNPTEEYVVNLINTFLRTFHIDVDTINKRTKEQQIACDDTDMIQLINLHAAMVQICDRIYLKDLCITDIISPGSKRIRKQAKLLANFILYATTKELEIKDKVDEIKSRARILQERLDKENEIIKAITDKQQYMAKQLSLKDKITIEIEEVQSRILKNKKEYHKLITDMTAVEEKKQQANKMFESSKVQVLNLSKTIAELKSKIVKSPETYEKQLKDLEEEKMIKIQQRETMQEAIQDKQNLIEQYKPILSFIQKQLDKLSKVKDIHQQFKKVNVQEDSIKKQIEVVRTEYEDFQKTLQTQKDKEKETNEVEDLHAQYEQQLTPLRNLNAQLLCDKKTYQQKLEEEQAQYNEEYKKYKNMQNVIQKLEEETSALIQNYQNIYDDEVKTVGAMWKMVDK
ncbi:uncharacterized protein LOC117228681 [Megalopta genalis]|uniref:uncharacterized protein LOC117228681 n=1 Tax=Megalopta genalis TaxID=115081 RepID=UPI00144302FC|nr:polyamine-modulated factor 1-binding protein 1-like [Megalopta genalis]